MTDEARPLPAVSAVVVATDGDAVLTVAGDIDIASTAIGALAAMIVGVPVAIWLLKTLGNTTLTRAKTEADLIKSRANDEAKTIVGRAELDAEKRIHERKEKFESESNVKREELRETERRLAKREDLVDRSLLDCIGPELAAWLQSFPATEHQPVATVEVIDPVWKGPFMVTVSELRDRDGQPTGRVLVARDLTPQSRLEVEREELRKRLTQSEKLAALGQFVAGIAHELNNPLQGVLGHLELLRATGAFPKQLRREVQTIYREADRAAKIVRNLLVFAGSRRLVKRSVSLTAVLQKVLALRQHAFRAAEIELVRDYDERIPRVHSDPLLLHQVFLNIVMNAEQAISSLGKPGRIEISTRYNSDTMRVITTVRDSGHGISPDALTRIFEPFYTTKEVGKGTGLGLAIAYGIMQEHGGHITAGNHADGGAVFTVEVPAVAGRTVTPRERHSAKDAEA